MAGEGGREIGGWSLSLGWVLKQKSEDGGRKSEGNPNAE